MFEKESLVYGIVNLPDGYTKVDYQKAEDWRKGAEFGYNKANEWHYIAEEGLPAEADKYYFIAYRTALGISGSYCKLVEEKVPIVPGYGHVTGYNTIKQWDCEDSETKAWMNEAGRVYAWMSLPDLPEYREYK